MGEQKASAKFRPSALASIKATCEVQLKDLLDQLKEKNCDFKSKFASIPLISWGHDLMNDTTGNLTPAFAALKQG